MTDSISTTTTSAITRRAAIASLATAPLLAGPTLADNADAELLALEREYFELWAALADDDAPGEVTKRIGAVEDRIREVPARTLGDLVVKARVTWNNRNFVNEDGNALARAVLELAGEEVHGA